MQNAGPGALLALKHFSAQAALIPAAFATWCVITASILAEVWAKKAEIDTCFSHPGRDGYIHHVPDGGMAPRKEH